MAPLSEWQNFYIIVGSAAGGLTGLQFVTAALLAEMPVADGEEQAGQAFSTPTIVHFGAVLLLSSLLVMPWRTLMAVTLAWGLTGLICAAYMLLIVRRIRGQRAYQPVLEDWLFRVVLPFLGYAGLVAAAVASHFRLHAALFGVAAVSLLLLFIGIHNAWDNVTYLVFVKRRNIQS